MLTWLDWYVRSRVVADASRPMLAQQMRQGAKNPISAFAETVFDAIAEREVDRDAFARAQGGVKAAEELVFRCACMAPFLWGLATVETQKAFPRGGPAVGILLTRETASLLSDADPPKGEWRRLTFGSEVGQEGLSGIYVDIPHGALRVGATLQIRTLFAIPSRRQGESDGDELCWTGGVIVHALVTKLGSEHECGSIYVVVDADDTLTLAAVDDQTPLGGILAEEATDDKVWTALYTGVVEHAVRFLRLVLAYRRYGPRDKLGVVGQTRPDDAMRNQVRPRKNESLFAITRLDAASDRLGRSAQKMPASWSLTARQEVSGHFRLQPYGPGAQLRRLMWIEAYTRGPESAPIKPRALRL